MICAVVLAAGQSRRMGTQKLLLPFGGKSVIAHIVDELLKSVIRDVIVVAGHEGDRIAAQLAGRAVSVAVNPRPEDGMLSSVRCGLRALPHGCEAVMAVLGDQPTLRAALVNRMIEAFLAAEKGIVVPVWEGKRGHPMVFARHYCEEILTRHDDVGLRGLLRAHPDDVLELPVASADVLSDMDYPEDYARALASLQDNARGPAVSGQP